MIQTNCIRIGVLMVMTSDHIMMAFGHQNSFMTLIVKVKFTEIHFRSDIFSCPYSYINTIWWLWAIQLKNFYTEQNLVYRCTSEEEMMFMTVNLTQKMMTQYNQCSPPTIFQLQTMSIKRIKRITPKSYKNKQIKSKSLVRCSQSYWVFEIAHFMHSYGRCSSHVFCWLITYKYDLLSHP